MNALLALALLFPAAPDEAIPPPRAVADVAPARVAGIWEGPLVVGPTTLRIAFAVAAPEAGPLTATMSSIDQTDQTDQTFLSTVEVRGREVTFRVTPIGARFAGRMSADFATLEGEWHQGPGSLPLTLKRVEKASKLNRPQHPLPPYPYTVKEVTFENAAAKVTLAGTLTTPQDGKPRAAVVLVSGSGPQDRDETLFGHKPFLVVADHLTRNGVAVLRYDDRGTAKSTGKFEGATTADYAADALAAVAFVTKKTGVDPKRVGVVGHSEGGVIGPMLAAKHPGAIGFLVMLAGPAVPGGVISRAQTAAFAKLGGASEAAVKRLGALNDLLMELVRNHKPGDELNAEAAKRLAAFADETPEGDRALLGLTPAGTKLLAGRLSDPWLHAFMLSDPAADLKATACPVLALFGEKDCQVDAKMNADALKKLNPKAVVDIRPGLNHLFQPCETGNLSEYGKIEATFDAATLARIGEWILALP